MYAQKFTGGKVSLAKIDTRVDGGLTREASTAQLSDLNVRLRELQELLYAAQQHSVLIVLQATDTGGKDGTIEHVMSGVNPQGCHVVSFKRPTEEDLLHDFLWRIHPHTPARGMMAIFNRSHYEDVLITRIHNLIPPKVWQARYDHINAFERSLIESGTIILKFFLHISKDEQLERLQARENEPEKRWKLNPGDYAERELWDDYRRAFEDALERCASTDAPWYVVPADRKWFRNLAVAEAIVKALEPHRDAWRRELLARGERAYHQVLDARGVTPDSACPSNHTASPDPESPAAQTKRGKNKKKKHTKKAKAAK
jgi:PPK2 family polyphosphate:nucleotide phosphotransferase